MIELNYLGADIEQRINNANAWLKTRVLEDRHKEIEY